MASLYEQFPGKAVPIRFKGAETDAYTGPVSPAIWLAILEASVVWGIHGADSLVVTALRDGKHRPASRHFRGEAVDLRTHNLKPDELLKAHELLKAALGPKFAVLLENWGTPNEHVHISNIADGGPA